MGVSDQTLFKVGPPSAAASDQGTTSSMGHFLANDRPLTSSNLTTTGNVHLSTGSADLQSESSGGRSTDFDNCSAISKTSDILFSNEHANAAAAEEHLKSSHLSNNSHHQVCSQIVFFTVDFFGYRRNRRSTATTR